MGHEEEIRNERQYLGLIKTSIDFESLKNNLNSNREKTLKTLIWATEKGELKASNKTGRKIWRRVTDYLSKNKLTDDLYEVEAKLSEIHSPMKSRLYVYLGSFLGGVCTAATLAMGDGYEVGHKIIQKKFHNNVVRLLR